MELDFDVCYRAVRSRDGRFDGRFFTGVTSTGIYCRPSCPSRTPLRANVRFYSQPAAAERDGFRPCRRCRPEVAPDAPDWDVRADLVGRALRLIAGGAADEGGVDAVADRLAVSTRHLHRLFVSELGAGPLAIARTRRAHLARQLIDHSDLRMADIAFAAGFSSIRAFNAVMRQTYGDAPAQLRREGRASRGPELSGRLGEPAAPSNASPESHVLVAGRGRPQGNAFDLRLRFRPPIALPELWRWLAWHSAPGAEEVLPDLYRRTVRMGDGHAVLELSPAEAGDHLVMRLLADDLAGLGAVVQGARRAFDLDADPAAIEAVLSQDPLLAPLVERRPGVRLPGAFDGFELAARVVLGQQVSVAAARTLAGRLIATLGTPLNRPYGSLTHLWPTPEAVADGDLTGIGLTSRRAETLRSLAAAVSAGTLVLDGCGDPADVTDALQSLPGVGPWTAAAVAMGALRDPDALPASDLGLRRALERLGTPGDPREVMQRAERWRPWRAYAVMHLWASLGDNMDFREDRPTVKREKRRTG
jgi:AraC family transcriptional regulator, regulatory protein of adaptative response / DNA-3-methyladenine glycosylase II